ncbi:MAG: GtrA family protein [Oscillospiraceae bacterium]|nr:GtrA family protein [Oscillospiraceae bacterium]
MNNKITELITEFGRCAIVGTLSFIIDSGTLVLFRELVFTGATKTNLFISAAMGFITGTICSYILSILFVFKSVKSSGNGKSFREFVLFALISLSGLGITELLMYAGVYILDIYYLIVKLVAAVIVLVWNYIGRKLLIFNAIPHETCAKDANLDFSVDCIKNSQPY